MKPRTSAVFLVVGTLLVLVLAGAQPAARQVAGVNSVFAAPLSRRLADAPWDTNVKVNDDVGTADQFGVRVAVDPSGNAYAVWEDYRNGNDDIYFSYRPAGGSWGSNIKVNDDAGTADHWIPSIAVDPSGNAYAVWNDMRNGNYEIYFSYRPAGGSWGSNITVNDDVGQGYQIYPSIAVDPSGNAYAVWEEQNYGIYFSYRPAGGSWGSNIKVSDDAGAAEKWEPSIAVDPSGNAYAVWDDGRNGNRDIYFSYLPAGSAGDTTPPGAVTDLAAATGATPGTVTLTWTAPGDDGNIGTASNYVVRYADSAIVSEFGWLMATDVSTEPTPQPAGSPQTMTLSDLTPGQTYYFAIKTQDEVPNTSGLSNSPSAIAKKEPVWTLMVYLDGDNNLDGTYVPIFNRLEAAANNPYSQVVALWDRLGSDDSAYYEVQYDTNLDNLAVYTESVNYWPKGELNMGDAATLVDFVNWSRTNYPAQHYALILSNHGSGLAGGMLDDTDEHDLLTVTEMGMAMADATQSGAHPIDVLYMDACLMAMIEDAYQVRDYVDYFVASENIQWSYTTAYSQYVSDITAATTPEQLATLFAAGYAAEMDASSNSYTISALDVAGLGEIVTATNSLAGPLNEQMEGLASTLTTITSSVQRFEMNGDGAIDAEDDYIDLYDFARLAKLHIDDEEIQAAAQAVMDTVAHYIPTDREHHGSAGSWDLDDSHGVSVFFPSKASSFYSQTNYDFAVGAAWPAGGSASLSQTGEPAVAWGPMLVSYFETTQPGGPDDPTPPLPLPRRQEPQVYVPLVLRNH